MNATPYHHPTRSDILAELHDRLASVQQTADGLDRLVADEDTPDAELVDGLEALEHDLLLAARSADSASEHFSV